MWTQQIQETSSIKLNLIYKLGHNENFKCSGDNKISSGTFDIDDLLAKEGPNRAGGAGLASGSASPTEAAAASLRSHRNSIDLSGAKVRVMDFVRKCS